MQRSTRVGLVRVDHLRGIVPLCKPAEATQFAALQGQAQALSRIQLPATPGIEDHGFNGIATIAAQARISDVPVQAQPAPDVGASQESELRASPGPGRAQVELLAKIHVHAQLQIGKRAEDAEQVQVVFVEHRPLPIADVRARAEAESALLGPLESDASCSGSMRYPI